MNTLIYIGIVISIICCCCFSSILISGPQRIREYRIGLRRTYCSYYITRNGEKKNIYNFPANFQNAKEVFLCKDDLKNKEIIIYGIKYPSKTQFFNELINNDGTGDHLLLTGDDEIMAGSIRMMNIWRRDL
jgi:hypothetical protein